MHGHRRPPSASVLFLFVSLIGVAYAPRAANAQYFGRNQVQYEEFDFEVLKTEHFDIYYYPEERPAAETTAQLAERWYARLSRLLNHELRGRQPLILYASHAHFRQTNALPGAPGEGTGGVTELFKRRIVLPFAGPLAETDHVLGHELVHAFQFDITGERGPVTGGRVPTALRLPLWFIEGMAEYLSVGPVDPHTAMWIRDAAAADDLPTIRQLSEPRYFPYRYGQALWAYIGGRWGDETVGRILKAAGKSADLVLSFQNVLGIPIDSLSTEWHTAIHEAYDPLLDRTGAPGDYGRPLITKGNGGRLNVAPALSPDGTQLVFFSERDLFSVDLFLADVATGKVTRKIVKTAVDPHFESLLFINSSGAWDAEGRRLAFGAVRKGQPVLALLDVERGKIEREIAFPQLGEILNPTWSPRGRAIVFSAIVGGVSDLFLYDLRADSLRRLTDDAFADLQPAWSPDGRSIAFVTDRFSSDLSNLRMGPYELAVLDPATGAIRALPGVSGAKNINPQWSPEGGSLYFLSDGNGITNVYRLELASGQRTQVTNLFTGISGITPLSPALSVAPGSGRLLFTVYEGGQYNIYAVDAPEALPGEREARPLAQVSPAVLPPQNRPEGRLMRILQDPTPGLAEGATFERTDYSAGLSLDYVGQPFLVVGADRFGTFVGGGTSLFWSDMLGNRNLATMLQVSGGVKDIAAVVAYQNRRRRWNWGVVGQQIPILTGGFAQGTGTIDGEPVFIEQILRDRQTNRQLAGVLTYPFSRVQRIEFQAGYVNIGFDRELETRAVSLVTGRVVVDEKEDLPTPDVLNLGITSAALVYDNSFFGATSPILGQRYRLEATPTIGSITYYTLLADYRRYVMPLRPFTLAGRVVHFGRYGGGAEDIRLFPLFLGYQGFVRGYNIGSFDADECNSTDLSSCPVFDQLLGSRMLVANLELRFPLLGALGLGSGYYGAFPLEAAIFTDAGVAWTRSDDASFFGGDRDPVASAGVALRLNLLGFAIAELDYVRPFDRPEQGWYFQFGLTPGF